MSVPRPAKEARTYAYNAFALATFTIGLEVGNTINVAVQLKDARANPVARRVVAKVFLSDVATGAGITAVATTSALAIGTNGALLNIPVTGKMVDVETDASGRFDLNIIQTAVQSYYLVVILPDGGIVVSSVIAFA